MPSRRLGLPISIMFVSLLICACSDDDTAPTGPASSSVVGSWTFTDDGEVLLLAMNADKTYSLVWDGMEIEHGAWSMAGDQLTTIESAASSGEGEVSCVHTVSTSGSTLTLAYAGGAGEDACGRNLTLTRQ